MISWRDSEQKNSYFFFVFPPPCRTQLASSIQDNAGDGPTKHLIGFRDNGSWVSCLQSGIHCYYPEGIGLEEKQEHRYILMRVGQFRNGSNYVHEDMKGTLFMDKEFY